MGDIPLGASQPQSDREATTSPSGYCHTAHSGLTALPLPRLSLFFSLITRINLGRPSNLGVSEALSP